MEKIKLGSLCLTKNDKSFDYKNKTILIKKGTLVSVCDDENVKEGYVLVEADGFETVFDYELEDLILIKNSL